MLTLTFYVVQYWVINTVQYANNIMRVNEIITSIIAMAHIYNYIINSLI